MTDLGFHVYDIFTYESLPLFSETIKETVSNECYEYVRHAEHTYFGLSYMHFYIDAASSVKEQCKFTEPMEIVANGNVVLHIDVNADK